MLYVMAATWLQTSPSRATTTTTLTTMQQTPTANTYTANDCWELELKRMLTELTMSKVCHFLSAVSYIHTICAYIHNFCISIFFKLMLHTHTQLINSMGNGQLLVELGRQHMHKYECAAINCFKPNPLGHPLLSTHNRISPQTASSICTSCESSFS